MPRSRAANPDYAYHVSGQARVYLDGRYFYLGTYDSPRSRAKYHALLAQYHANDRRIPADTITHKVDQPITVDCVLAEWKRENEGRSALTRYKPVCDVLEIEYGNLPAVDFGPRMLRQLRDTMLADGKRSRKWINEQIRTVCRIFEHAVSCEIIEFETYKKLTTLAPLRSGESTAREQVPRSPVPLADIAATVKELSPVLAAMVRVQLGTGMRSGEVTGVRPIDIDQSGDEWVYRPASHKTAHHGVVKAVPIVDSARAALEPFMDRPAEMYCFSPIESDQWFREKRRQERKTPVRYEKRVFKFERHRNARYRSDSYRQAVVRAAERAGVSRWTPAQIRHTTATEIREAIGLEQASALLGHTTVGMTEHYARQSLSRAIEAAKAGPSV